MIILQDLVPIRIQRDLIAAILILSWLLKVSVRLPVLFLSCLELVFKFLTDHERVELEGLYMLVPG